MGPELVVAVDVGGTTMKSAVVRRDGTLLQYRIASTGRGESTDRIVDNLCQLARQQLQIAGEVAALSIVVPGVVDSAAGIARYSANLGWRDLPLVDLIRGRLGLPDLPVVLDHDVRAGGIAEAIVGAGHGLRHVLFVPIGTGIAAAIVTDGHAYAGANFAAGEIGHLPVVPRGEECGCGRYGCLETVASAASLIRRYAAASGVVVTGADEVVQGDSPMAVQVWNEALDALATGLSQAITLLDPSAVVIGGGLSLAGARLLEPLSDRLSGLLGEVAPPLLLARTGDRAGCIGAAILGFEAAGVMRNDLDWPTSPEP